MQLTVLFDSPFNSPFVIPVAGCAMVLGIVVAIIWAGVRSQEMKMQERLAAISKGLAAEPELHASFLREAATTTGTGRGMRQLSDGAGARRTGIVLTSVGVGLGLFFVALATILRERDVLCGGATGLIPLAIGVGFLIDGRLRRTEFERAQEGAGTMPFAPVQGSELRPLH